MKKISSFILFLFSIACTAQENPVLDLYQDTLQTICEKLFISKTDAEKQKLNRQLLFTFERTLNTANSFDYPFDSLKKYMAILTPPDNKFKIINWNLPKDDGSQEYYGFIQEKYKKEKVETIQLYPLIDKSAETKNPENAITDNKKWYGMLYYKIIPKKTKNKTYYTLLAWDGNDKFSRKKIIDVLTFDVNGTPRFGADIFNMQKKYPKRVIFEYSASCNMSLKYSDKKDSIVFDHLAPTSPQLEGQFQYYCGDMSYDGFGFKKGKWNYGMDLNAINEKDYKDKLYKDPKGTPPVNPDNEKLNNRKKDQKKMNEYLDHHKK